MALNWNRDQTIFVLFGALYNFFTWMIWSLETTFFPAEAEHHNVSSTIYGVIASLFDMVAVVLSPILGTYLAEKYILSVTKTAPFVISISFILWSVLPHLADKAVFISISCILRITLGIGNSLLFVTSSTIITGLFEETDGVLSIMVGAQAIGMVCGPLLGGVLLDAIGFTWTFVALGVLVTVVGIPFVFLLKFDPNNKVSKAEPEEKLEESSKKESKFSVLKRLDVWLSLLILIMIGFMLTFPYIALEPYLRSFHLSNTQIGFVFVIFPAVFALSNTVCGNISSKIGYLTSLILCAFTACVGYSIIAPISIFPVETNLPMVCGGLAVFGWGGGAIFTIVLLFIVSKSTDSQLAMGLWQSDYEIGNVLGAAVGGIMVDYIGFSDCTFIVTAICLVLTILLAVKQFKDVLFGCCKK